MEELLLFDSFEESKVEVLWLQIEEGEVMVRHMLSDCPVESSSATVEWTGRDLEDRLLPDFKSARVLKSLLLGLAQFPFSDLKLWNLLVDWILVGVLPHYSEQNVSWVPISSFAVLQCALLKSTWVRWLIILACKFELDTPTVPVREVFQFITANLVSSLKCALTQKKTDCQCFALRLVTFV